MSWFLCVISQKPFLEWEIEKFLKVHPQTSNTIIKPSFYFSYDCREGMVYRQKSHEDDPTIKMVIGKGYISKSTGYSQADENDWDKLLNFDFLPTDIDGHYLALKIRDNFLQITCDMFGHYPVYYIDAEEYFIISTKQHFISQLIGKKQWDYCSLSALALLDMPLEKRAFLKKIAVLNEGSTLTVSYNKITVEKREIKFGTDDTIDTNKYFFSLKKAYEIQLNEGDFVFLPFEEKYSSRFAFSVWCNKAKKDWGLYHPKNSDVVPVEYIEDFVLSKLKIQNIPDFRDSKQIFAVYKDYVLSTGLAKIPEYFHLAGTALMPSMPLKNEINIVSYHSEWLFEKEPLKKIEKIYKVFKDNSFNDFKKNFVSKNHFFRKEFYPFLLKGLKLHFDDFTKKMYTTETIYDKYFFLLRNYHTNIWARGLAWLNNYKNFYSPGLLYSLSCNHLQQRFNNKKISETSSTLHETFSAESLNYPKPKEPKYSLPLYPHKNMQFFPKITNEIGLMIENAENIQYYDFPLLLKMFKKANKGNPNAVDEMMKWTAFEIWRQYLE